MIMKSFMDIFSREPVNKTASLQVDQSGCSGSLTDQQKYENLMLAREALIDKKHKLNKLAIEEGFNLGNIDCQISRLKEKIKAERHAKTMAQQEKKRSSKERKHQQLMELDRLCFVHLKKLIKPTMDFEKYVAMVEEAERLAKAELNEK